MITLAMLVATVGMISLCVRGLEARDLRRVARQEQLNARRRPQMRLF
jgi:hypothetical protein